mgnify:CR=1 FL=1
MRLTTEPTHRLDRAAHGFLAAHVGLITFSTLAMVTVLVAFNDPASASPQMGQVLASPYFQKVYDLGWRYSGQIYILLGTLAALAHSAPRIGTGRAVLVMLLASGVALSSELGGTNIGFPFGPYRYTEMLGYRIGGDVPYPIPISWYYMLYGSLAICARTMVADDSGARRWRWALVGGAILTAWDVAMEVQMTHVKPVHWAWELDRLPTWLPTWTHGTLFWRGFYQMPVSNWVGWYLTGVVISRLMLALVPPTVWRDRVAPAGLPLVLYAANGLMPIAVTARYGYHWAALGGLVAMGLPLWLARRPRTP